VKIRAVPLAHSFEGERGVDKENNPPTPAGDEPAREQPSVEELLDASRGEARPRPAATRATTPVTPSAAEASTGTRPSAAPAGDTPEKEVPAATPPAARVAPQTGASKTTSTPTPAVNQGVSKAVATKTPAAVKKPAGPALPEMAGDAPINKMRRRIVWASVFGFLTTSFLMFVRFFLPRAIFEPSSVFRVGFPGDYNFGVDTKWQQQYRIWVVKNTERLFVIYARCTHLGCTPDWKESENKFKCPCHGSGYDSEGINFEGPAPRPMDRAQVSLDAEGQVVVNTGKLYDWPKGTTGHFNDEGAFIRLG
jgi:cytochrome b6-f complex iron-sulfur subunit